jgi:hypothetical protein
VYESLCHDAASTGVGGELPSWLCPIRMKPVLALRPERQQERVPDTVVFRSSTSDRAPVMISGSGELVHDRGKAGSFHDEPARVMDSC